MKTVSIFTNENTWIADATCTDDGELKCAADIDEEDLDAIEEAMDDGESKGQVGMYTWTVTETAEPMGSTYHVTSIRNGGVYGHPDHTCDEAGCAGTEMYLGSTDELPDAVLHEELWIAETDSCDHRSGSGQASAKDLERFSAGDECQICKCTLGADGYWYVDADQAPSPDEDQAPRWTSVELYGGNVSCRVPADEADRARELIEAADEGGVIQATDMVGIFPGRPEMHTTTMLLSALTSIGAEIGD